MLQCDVTGAGDCGMLPASQRLPPWEWRQLAKAGTAMRGLWKLDRDVDGWPCEGVYN